MTVLNPRTLIEVHTPEFTMFLLHINSSPQNCSSLLISKVSCWNCLNLEIMLQSKKLLGRPRRPKKHFAIRRGWSHLPTSQLTCLSLIFNSPLRQCKSELTATAPRQHLFLQTTAHLQADLMRGAFVTISPWPDTVPLNNRPAPHRRPKLGPAFCQSTTHPDYVTARYYRNYVTTRPILTAHIFLLPRIYSSHDRVFDILNRCLSIFYRFSSSCTAVFSCWPSTFAASSRRHRTDSPTASRRAAATVIHTARVSCSLSLLDKKTRRLTIAPHRVFCCLHCRPPSAFPHDLFFCDLFILF